MKDGGFAVLSVASEKGRVRLVDPVAWSAREITLEEAQTLSSGAAILVTRRLGGAGIDPNTFGFRWFWPSILRYRRPLAHVLVASLFVQLFALATPIFFQLVVDKVLVHKGMSTLVVLVIGMVTLGLFETVLQFLRSYTLSHTTQPHRRRARPAALSSPLPPAARLFRDPRRRADGRAHARAADDPRLTHRPGPDRGPRPCVHPRLLFRALPPPLSFALPTLELRHLWLWTFPARPRRLHVWL
jgi:ABC transporter transmembrane region